MSAARVGVTECADRRMPHAIPRYLIARARTAADLPIRRRTLVETRNGNAGGHSVLTLRLKAAIALQVVAGEIDMRVFGDFQRETGFAHLSIAATAFPRIAHFGEIRVSGHGHRNTGRALAHVATHAAPDVAASFIHHVPVSRWHDREARVVLFAITAIALPTVLGRVDVSVGGDGQSRT